MLSLSFLAVRKSVAHTFVLSMWPALRFGWNQRVSIFIAIGKNGGIDKASTGSQIGARRKDHGRIMVDGVGLIGRLTHCSDKPTENCRKLPEYVLEAVQRVATAGDRADEVKQALAPLQQRLRPEQAESKTDNQDPALARAFKTQAAVLRALGQRRLPGGTPG